MERFVCAGFEATGELQQHGDARSMTNARMQARDVNPSLKALSLDIETRGSSQQLYSIAGAMTGGSNQSSTKATAVPLSTSAPTRTGCNGAASTSRSLHDRRRRR